jgi:UDP-N-acetyl-D-glucosamine dehydrogenase
MCELPVSANAANRRAGGRLMTATPIATTLNKRFHDRIATIGVIGLGYVGLPLVRAFTTGGVKCIGFDVDPIKIDKLTAGESYIQHIPADVITPLIQSGRFTPTTDFTKLKDCDALIICVPTPLTRHRDPDMTYVATTAATIGQHLRPGQLVVLESTTYPGTTRDIVLPELTAHGLVAGTDFLLAYSPEREDPGRTDFGTSSIPKVVGGYDEPSRDAAVALYSIAIKQIVPVSSLEVAEASKILENCYRCINIAMINEMKIIFDKMGIDVWEVIAAAKTKPFGFQPFYPGPGLGGHCIPIDPFYLSWKARKYDVTARFIELAGELNASMPSYVIGKIADVLNASGKPIKGSRILVLGLAYKKDVDDLRESPSVVLIEQLQARGAVVEYHDPHIPRTHKQRDHDLQMESVPLTPERLAAADVTLIATDHSVFDYASIVEHSRAVVDTRNATANVTHGREKITKA